ncbi:MAG: GNAT family N-acetyltransferase [Polyangiaceae bacterium]
MYELHVASRVKDIPRESWDALVGEHDSPFVEWTWLDCLEESGCAGVEAGWLPCHLALHKDGKLVAVAPTYLKDNSEGEFVFDWNWADLAQRMHLPYYPKLVVGVPFTPATGARILTAPGEDRVELIHTLASALVKIAPELKAHGIHALFLTEDETKTWCETGFMHRYGIQFHWKNNGYKTFDDFLASFNAKKRAQIKREVRQPAKDGVTIETLTADEYTKEMTLQMYEFYATTVDKFRWGRRYLNVRFFELLVERFRSRLSWVVARQNGEAIAGAFNVVKGDVLYGRYWGATKELPFLHFNVCYYHGVKQCIEGGLQVFEPGAGGEHKRVRGFLPTITHSAHWLEDRRMGNVIDAFLERERAAIVRHVTEDHVTEP